MVNDPRVFLLLEEIMDSGCAPEDLCRACPELLPAVLEGLARVRALEAEVAAMFPADRPQPHGARAPHGSASRFVETELPVIPGYAVLGVLGRGGMGVVYKARHLQLQRIVAVKMLLMGDYASPLELARFLREAQAIAVLRHPHIMQIYDIGDLQGRPFSTMEYVEGGSLAQRLAGEPQPARGAAALVATLAEAVQIAHRGGIVHRDLKPANILLTAEGTPKIGDFGLARSTAEGPDLTVGGARLGTPSYMSPEQALGRRDTVGPSTDVYSLGAVLYEMLTGRPPFKAETPAETERQVIAEEPAPPSRLNAKVPRDLETICLKCLSKDPERCYATASDLANDLHRFLRGEPIAARRAGAVERLGKWSRRHPARTAAWLGGGDTSAMFGARIAQSSARTALIDAMDDWSICAPDGESLAWILLATRTADRGSAWRQSARDIAVWRDAAALSELARTAPVESEPVSLLLIVAGRLLNSDPDASVQLLRRIQAAHPSNFWANFALAESLDDQLNADAIEFYRAAVALRPEASAAHFNLGAALAMQKRDKEAIDSLQRAVSLDPQNWKPHFKLAIALGRSGRFDEALGGCIRSASSTATPTWGGVTPARLDDWR